MRILILKKKPLIKIYSLLILASIFAGAFIIDTKALEDTENNIIVTEDNSNINSSSIEFTINTSTGEILE